MRTLSALFAVLLVSVAMMPAVSAQSEKRFEEELLRDVGIKVNNIDTELCDYKKVGDTIYEENRQKAPHFSGGMNAVLQ